MLGHLIISVTQDTKPRGRRPVTGGGWQRPVAGYMGSRSGDRRQLVCWARIHRGVSRRQGHQSARRCHAGSTYGIVKPSSRARRLGRMRRVTAPLCQPQALGWIALYDRQQRTQRAVSLRRMTLNSVCRGRIHRWARGLNKRPWSSSLAGARREREMDAEAAVEKIAEI